MTTVAARLRASGVELAVPRGWDAAFARRPAGPSAPGSATRAAAEDNVLLHAATFPLPPVRGDYGSGALDSMGPDGVFVSLMEMGPSQPGARLFGLPVLPRLDPRDFSPASLQRPQRDQTGAQYFLTLAERPFGLFVVLGSHDRRAALVPVARELLAGLTVVRR